MRDPPNAEQITDADIHQYDQAAASNTLNNSARQQHLNAARNRTDQAPHEKHDVGHQQDRLASKNVADLPPRRSRRGSCQQIGGSDPGIVRLRSLEMSHDGREGGRDDCLWHTMSAFAERDSGTIELTMSKAARKTAS